MWCQSWLPVGTQLASASSDWTLLIWAVAEPAGEPGRVTAAALRASVRHTDAPFWGLAERETVALWQQPAVARVASGFGSRNGDAASIKN